MIAKREKYKLFHVFPQALEPQASLVVLITVNDLILMPYKPANE